MEFLYLPSGSIIRSVYPRLISQKAHSQRRRPSPGPRPAGDPGALGAPIAELVTHPPLILTIKDKLRDIRSPEAAVNAFQETAKDI
ncbi:hypothetical protein EVAR_53164_1 [Eumeta japonica]|uniref:Uncharacterized protein n=1 Tax=Eumeta variegata TaxID=151549 RepID=A0A4C1YYZ0_EUMVA|nr:hypothetical protein EVAR_53164_1 [Eumeta japonica]